MNLSKVIKGIACFILACLVITMVCFVIFKINKRSSSDGESGIEKNIGISHITTNIDLTENGIANTIEFSADQVVPAYDSLLQNLTEQGYEIETYDTVFDLGVSAKRVYASKKDKVVDITYLTEDSNTNTVFKKYESEYETYYLLAQNEDYVYYFSNHDAFDAAGFTSLANNGVQYINHDRY